MISNLNLDIEILHIEIDLNMLFLIFIEYNIIIYTYILHDNAFFVNISIHYIWPLLDILV